MAEAGHAVSRDEGTADRELFTSRVIDAPRDRVFKVFADPAHLAQWWGPTGFTSTFTEFDLRPNGAWRFVMHGPGGVSYPNESVFVEGGRTTAHRLATVHPPRSSR